MATLQEQLNEFKEKTAQNAPAEILNTIQNDIDHLIQSDIVEKSIKAGQKAPDFTLPDAVGKEVTLTELLRQGPVVVTFYRGEWCPYCNLQLHAYQQIMPQIQELGASLVAISPQTPDHSLSMAEKHALTFHVLSDAGNVVARQYGVVFAPGAEMRAVMTQIGSDVAKFNGDDSWELPMPSTFIIAQDGTIKLAHVDPDFRQRLDSAELLAGLRNLTA